MSEATNASHSSRAPSTLLRPFLALVAIPVLTGVFMAGTALAGGDLVAFPENYADGVHYGTVNRGNIREELYTSQEAIAAARQGKPFPDGTVITLVDYREGGLYRYVVMEKRAGWGEDYPPALRNGEWEFQAFHADKSINHEENLERCFSCHKSKAGDDYVQSLDLMKK